MTGSVSVIQEGAHVILSGSWVTKQGCTPEIVPIRRGFSIPVVTLQLCYEVFSICSFNNL